MTEAPTTDARRDRKPRLALFRTIRANLPAFILQHFRQHEACLGHAFDVRVFSGDCDFDAACAAHEADLAMFESGVYARPSRIANLASHPSLPRVGFFNGDAYCSSRLVFLQDMRRFGVGTCFALSTRTGEFLGTGDIELFYWPNFIDPLVHRDHGLRKTVPILFTGSLASHYPWRNRVRAALAPQFPILACPHPGWFDAHAAGRVAQGEDYARLINAAQAAPTCGTVADEVVRKHFEIPGCRTLLVTEKTDGLLAAGFRHMENCVFAEPQTVVDILDALLKDPDACARITDAGHALVHARHTDRQRRQIRDWFDLRRAGAPAGPLRQATPFSPIRADKGDAAAAGHARSTLRALQAEGDAHLVRGAHEAAARVFARCLNLHPLPEALVGLARCRLLQGEADEAAGMLADWIDGVLDRYGQQDPDPVELAWLAAARLCQGDGAGAAAALARFPTLAHPELDWARAAVAAIVAVAPAPEAGRTRGLSLHGATAGSADAWMETLARMLAACGRDDSARRLRGGGPPAAPGAPRSPSRAGGIAGALRGALGAAARAAAANRAVRGRAESMARAAVRGGRLPDLGWLPAADWLARFDDFVAVIRAAAPQAQGATAVVICEAQPSVYAREFLRRLSANPDVEDILVAAPPGFRARRTGFGPRPRTAGLDAIGGASGPKADILFLELARFWAGNLVGRATAAHVVALHDVTSPSGLRLFRGLSAAGTHDLAAHDPCHGLGYALFERRLPA